MPRHQTIRKELKQNYLKLKTHKYVKNIALGRYDNCRHRYTPGVIRYQMGITNGFKAFGYDGSGVIPLFVYVSPLEKIEEVKQFIKDKLS